MSSYFRQIEKYCEICDRQLTLNNTRDIERKRFCSRTCVQKEAVNTMRKNSKGSLYKLCPECNQEFRTFKSQNKTYCSMKCFLNRELEFYLERVNGYLIRYNRKTKKREFKHVTIVEKILGRKLKTNECIHHINMIKYDNRNCNLLVCTHSYHAWLHKRYAKRFAELHLGGKI